MPSPAVISTILAVKPDPGPDLFRPSGRYCDTDLIKYAIPVYAFNMRSIEHRHYRLQSRPPCWCRRTRPGLVSTMEKQLDEARHLAAQRFAQTGYRPKFTSKSGITR